MIDPEFAPIVDWLTANGRSVREEDDGFAASDDEVVLHVSGGGSGWTIRRVWRDDDRGIAFATSSVEDIDRYLALLTANEVRARRGLAPLRHGISTDAEGVAQPVDGLVLSGDLGLGFTLVDGPAAREWRFASDIEAARFSRYRDVTPDRLRAAILAPDRRIDA